VKSQNVSFSQLVPSQLGYTSEDFSSSNNSDVSWDKKINYKDYDTDHKLLTFLSPLVDDLCLTLNKYGEKNASCIFSDIKKYKLIEKKIFSKFQINRDDLLSLHGNLIEAFRNAPTKSVKTQILSLFASDFAMKVILSVIPETNEHKIKLARKHKTLKGAGAILEKQIIFRKKIKIEVLDYFLEFIVGEDYLQDVAYGTLNLSTARGKLVMPNIVRLTSNSRLISHYIESCKEQQMKALSERTCFRILDKCPASFRKSLQGLDSMKVDGINSFEKLKEIVESLESNGLNRELSSTLKNLIQSGLNYLKFGFRKYLKKSSECSDHCVNYALSELIEDKNKHQDKHPLSIKCDHEHTRNCIDCLSIERIFEEFHKQINCLVNDEAQKKTLLFFIKKSKEQIFDWKFHIIRGFNQDSAKYELLDQIKDMNGDKSSLIRNEPNSLIGKINNTGPIVIVKDFAMKFEVSKFMETQQEFYAKRVISWHVSVLAFNENGFLKTLAIVHLLEHASQDSDCVIGILDSLFRIISSNFENPTINTGSDNAACYHSQDVTCLLPLFADKHKVNLESYLFSEPQMGKGICDRKISVLKRTLIQYVNDGNNITNTDQMKNAFLSNPDLKDTIILCCSPNESLNFKKKISFDGISKYHSILYESEKIKFFRYHGIGSGKLVFYAFPFFYYFTKLNVYWMIFRLRSVITIVI
jgi:hypothetical protein